MALHHIVLLTACFYAAANPGEEDHSVEVSAKAIEFLKDVFELRVDTTGKYAFDVISHGLTNYLPVMQNWQFLLEICDKAKVTKGFLSNGEPDIKNLSPKQRYACRILLRKEPFAPYEETMKFLIDVGHDLLKEPDYETGKMDDQLIEAVLRCAEKQPNRNYVMETWSFVVSVCQKIWTDCTSVDDYFKAKAAEVACKAFQAPPEKDNHCSDQSIDRPEQSNRPPRRKAATKSMQTWQNGIEKRTI